MAQVALREVSPGSRDTPETEPYTHATIALAGAMFLMLNSMGAGVARIAVEV